MVIINVTRKKKKKKKKNGDLCEGSTPEVRPVVSSVNIVMLHYHNGDKPSSNTTFSKVGD